MKNCLLFLLLFFFIACKRDKKNEALSYAVFNEIPITCIQPTGWLQVFLTNQRNGLTGHLENAKYPFNACGWNGRADSAKCITSWWPFEQNGYWIDGMIRCGLLLKDSFLINKAMLSINYTLDHPDSSGFLGGIA